ncbi:MAG TPA: amidinotransferase [Saprospiraceae bacterium]|nr:amidinotransferase [Saprospiraceae bacterium]
MENSPIQLTSHFLMVRPAAFGPKEETMVSNSFPNIKKELNTEEIRQKAIQEFDNMVDILRKHGIHVLVVQDTPTPIKPDAVFPAHWISTHPNGHVILYPMLVQSRRLERRKDILVQIEKEFVVKQYHHFEQYEANGRVLEGAGSIVFDRANKVAFACSGPRTDATLLVKLCKEIEYQPASFRATDHEGGEIYHTDVMMMVADTFAVVCMESVADGADKLLLKQFLRTTQKSVIDISFEQMYAFAGNMIQVQNDAGVKYTILSASAKAALTTGQLEKIQSFNPILSIPIPTIEQYGGGSVRSMMVEIFLKPKKNGNKISI